MALREHTRKCITKERINAGLQLKPLKKNKVGTSESKVYASGSL
jgi:hypothetical protein